MFLSVKRIVFGVLVLYVFNVHASIGISPTLVTIGPNNPVANLTLSNEGDAAVTMQLKLVKWTQRQNEEIYKDTDDLIATPQIFIIPPHKQQLVRIGLERPFFGNKEKAYRLFAQEVIPRQILRKSKELKMALRLSIPVIIQAAVPTQQKIVWRVTSLGEKNQKIVAQNQGNNVVFINLIQAFSAQNQPATEPLTTFAYLLPGSEKYWIMKKSLAHDIRSIKASMNSKTVFVNVT